LSYKLILCVKKKTQTCIVADIIKASIAGSKYSLIFLKLIKPKASENPLLAYAFFDGFICPIYVLKELRT
jgi:hypothetical protein